MSSYESLLYLSAIICTQKVKRIVLNEDIRHIFKYRVTSEKLLVLIYLALRIKSQ